MCNTMIIDQPVLVIIQDLTLFLPSSTTLVQPLLPSCPPLYQFIYQTEQWSLSGLTLKFHDIFLYYCDNLSSLTSSYCIKSYYDANLLKFRGRIGWWKVAIGHLFLLPWNSLQLNLDLEATAARGIFEVLNLLS